MTVVTSFPKELTQACKTAFEKANPTIKLEILNKNTVQGIADVRELPVGQRPEIFWASAPDAFEVLAGQKLLDSIAALANKAIHAADAALTRMPNPKEAALLKEARDLTYTPQVDATKAETCH